MNRTQSQRMFSAVTGAIVFGLFGLAFVGAGIAISISGYRRDGWTVLAFSAIFELIGLGIAVACVGSVVMVRRCIRREAAHPEEPWLWNSDKPPGVISAHAAGAAVGAWIIAALWNVPTVGSVIAIVATRVWKPIELVVIPFLFIGAYVLRSAVRTTLSAERYGQSTLRLSTIPGQIGGRLQGKIVVARAMTAGTRLRLRLTCSQTTGTGDGRSTNVAWEDEMIVGASAEASSREGGKAAIPVDFAIPSDQPETTPIGSGRSVIEWKVTANAESPTDYYECSFTVPVFEVPESQIVHEPIAAGSAFSSQQMPVTHPGIRLTPLADGGCRIDLAAGRNRSLGLFLTAMATVFVTAAILVPQSSPPIWVGLILWTFATVLSVMTINVWLSSATITARRDGLHIERGLPLMKIRREISAASIRSITERSNAQMGDTYYYTLTAETDSQPVRIAGGIRGKPAANWVAAELRTALKMQDTQFR